MARGWPGMAEARLLVIILDMFEGFGGRLGPVVVTVLIIFWSIFSFRFCVSVLEAIDLDFEAHFGDFFEPEGARGTKNVFQ